jgi:ATP-dependent helicase/DNAse subunit B
MLSGWDHVATLKVLRLAPRLAAADSMDRFDFAVREQLPSSGLAALKELARESHAEKLEPLLERLSALDVWRALTLAPQDWAARLRELRDLFRPALRETPSHQTALEWRSQAEELDAFEEALDEAAEALADGACEIPIAPFWRTVKSVLRLQVLRLADQRRNLVHVLSAPEARQWVVPVVFVCGLVEKQFPKFHPQDPFFPEAARCRLNDAGIRLRTVAEFEREERSLFDAAISRATLLTVLSYPEFDSRGDKNLRSLYLEEFAVPEKSAPLVRPAPPRAASVIERRPSLTSPDLLIALREKTARISPTPLESFLQCPFQYFSRYTLRLKTRPLRPDDRLDFLTQGILVHEALKCWYAEPRDIGAIFARLFADQAEEKRIPRSYRTERLRNLMLDDLRAFTADTSWPREGCQSRFEEQFAFPLAEGIEVYGKIDRLDIAEDGRAYVFDYKYSNAQNTKGRRKSDLLLQAPLYLLAAERCFQARPAGMFYIGLKGGVVYEGWSEEGLLKKEPLPPDWLEITARRTLRAVEEIRGGRTEAAPADPEKCRFCDCRDICRVGGRETEAIAEGA